MTAMTHDTEGADLRRSGVGEGVTYAVVAAVAFGLAGALGRPLLEAGWSAGTVTVLRIGVGALATLPLGLHAVRGRWWLLRRNAGIIATYAVMAVLVPQFFFFSAVRHMQVGPALMIEYTAPVAVVAWMWVRHGQAPTRLTLVGATIAGLGLLFVLDLVSGGSGVSLPGTLWALGAMVGLAVFFIVSADLDNGMPPVLLATSGLVVASLLSLALAAVGVLPITIGDPVARFDGFAAPAWAVLLTLGLVSAGLSYVAGIAAGRRLGSRLASFVGLTEVLAAVGAAWLLLGELPGFAQLVGGALILIGVVAVKAGEPRGVAAQ